VGNLYILIFYILIKFSRFYYIIFWSIVISQRQYKNIFYFLFFIDMARSQAKSNIKKNKRQPLILKDLNKIFILDI